MLLFLLGGCPFFSLEDAENYQKEHPFHRPFTLQFPSLSPMLFSVFIATGEDRKRASIPLLFFLSCVFCHIKGNRRREGKEKER